MMVKIQSYNDSFNADWAKGTLEAEQIPVMIKSAGHMIALGMNTILSPTGGFDIYVPEEHAERAIELLDAYLGKR